MPNYAAHTAINTAIGTVLSFPLASQMWMSQQQLHFMVVGYAVATVFLSPDLDLYHASPTRNWGPLRVLWWPYAALFRHRGLSHSVFLSSITRILYLGILLIALAIISQFVARFWSEELWPTLADVDLTFVSQLWTNWSTELVYFCLGVCFADFCHILTDYIFSLPKAFRKVWEF